MTRFRIVGLLDRCRRHHLGLTVCETTPSRAIDSRKWATYGRVKMSGDSRWFRWGAVALGALMLFPLVPTAPASAAAGEPENAPLVALADAATCDQLLDRLIDVDRCASLVRTTERAVTAEAPAVSDPTNASEVVVSTAGVGQATLVSGAFDDQEESSALMVDPCPVYSIGQALSDPQGDWDGDSLSNAFELYSQLDLCSTDVVESPAARVATAVAAPIVEPVENLPEPAAAPETDVPNQSEQVENPCPNFSAFDVLANPNADWDGDLAPNSAEFYNNQNPCVFDDTMNDAIRALQPQASQGSPCPAYSAEDVLADQAGDWDRDRASNAVEFFNNADPCVFDADGEAMAREFATTAADSATTPCPNFSVADVNEDPTGDWDQDRSTNSFEFYNDLNPCEYQAPVEDAGDFTPGPGPGSPCPDFSVGDVFDDPDGDWDGDVRHQRG